MPALLYCGMFWYTSKCALTARVKAACRPFNADRAWRKTKEEMMRRAQARRTKQRMDAEWKKQVLEKLEKVNKLVVQVQRVADVLERIAGIRSKTLEDGIISWPESGGEETETLERVDKRKQREQSSDRIEKEGQVERQEDKNAMKGMKEGSSCKGTPNPRLRSPFHSSRAILQPIQYYYIILGLTPIIPRALRCHPTLFPCSDPGYQCRDTKTL